MKRPIVSAIFVSLATAILFLLPVSAYAGLPEVLVSPETVRRGLVTNLEVTGRNFSQVEEVSVSGDRMEILEFTGSSDLLEIQLLVGDRQVSGAQTLTIEFSIAADLVIDDAFSVIPGTPDLFSLTPDALVRASGAAEVTFSGLNLDAVTAVDIGEGITVTDFLADSGDPTKATAMVEVSSAAWSGYYPVTLSSDEGTGVLEGGFSVTAGELIVESVSPESATRGETLIVTCSGENLDIINSADFGYGVSVNNVSVVSPASVEITLVIGEESTPVGTLRTVNLSGDDVSIDVESSFTVNPGLLSVTRVRPDRLTQGTSAEITVEGINLDNLTEFAAGEGIDVMNINALSPLSSVVSVELSEEAPLGLRDVTISGEHGSVTIVDGLRILEKVLPPPEINYPDVVDLGSVEIDARKRQNMLFINQTDVDEPLELEITGGDINDFAFYVEEGETLTELNPELMTVTVPANSEQFITVEFRPHLQASSSATVDITAREEFYGSLTLRGNGFGSVLAFNPVPPVTISPVLETETGFKQVNTLSEVSDRVVITEIEVHGERNNSAFPEAAELTSVTLSDPLAPEEEYLFGVTLLTIETSYPDGSYEGEIWVHTDRVTAPILALPFVTSVTAVEQPEPAPDAFVEQSGDMGASDMGGSDMGVSDLGQGSDAALSDSGSNQGGSSSSSGQGSNDDSGCRTVDGNQPALVLWGLFGVFFIGVRRRKARKSSL